MPASAAASTDDSPTRRRSTVAARSFAVEVDVTNVHGRPWLGRAQRPARSGPVEDADRLEPALEVMLERPGGEVVDLVGGARVRLGQCGRELPSEDALQQVDRLGRDAGAAPVVGAQQAAGIQIEGHEGPLAAALGAA